MIPGRQKAAAPQAIVERLVVRVARPLRDHGDERGQVLIFTTQSVRQPGADAGPARELGTSLEEGDGGVVIDRLGMHRLDEAQVVHDLGRVRQEFADPCPALAVPGELERGRGRGEAGLSGGHAGQALTHANRVRQLGAAQRVEFRLVIEQVHLRGSAGLEQVDDAFGFRRKVRQVRKRPGRWRGRGRQVPVQE